MGRPTELMPEQVAGFAPAVSALLDDIAGQRKHDNDRYLSVLRRHPRPDGGLYRKSELVAAYRWLVAEGRRDEDPILMQRIRMKPVRTLSGVTPVTVLTMPWPCPGKCIFCPTDVRMPKSYLHDEPGAMRAEQHGFDPYEQVQSRIQAFEANGHNADKIELLILGGTWSAYPRDYQERFVQRCFDAMNGRDTTSLAESHTLNETARRRNVGLVLETRPDHISAAEIRRMRELGCTKVQLGAQTIDDRILAMNRRGHTVAQLREAMIRLRAAGFKLVLHWMPNLHGATVEGDHEDFARIFSDPALCPDELKIYSTQLLPNAQLHEYYQRGEYKPYSEAELLELILACKQMVPTYCRINRVYRDIPGQNVVDGCRLTNMRQVIQERMRRESIRCACIRCREVKSGLTSADSLLPGDLVYRTDAATEHFLSMDTDTDQLAGYLRLSLPDTPGSALGEDLQIRALDRAALVREIHVYGRAQELGTRDHDRTQHRGLGTRLLRQAEDLARGAGYTRLTVIASVGTREWYAQRGYQIQDSYMVKELEPEAGA